MGAGKCEYGASTASPPSKNVVTVYLPPAHKQPILFMNTKELDFFHQKLAANFDGHFDGDFWSTFVMQLAHTEAAV